MLFESLISDFVSRPLTLREDAVERGKPLGEGGLHADRLNNGGTVYTDLFEEFNRLLVIVVGESTDSGVQMPEIED